MAINQNMNVTLQELLRAINIFGEDLDVTVDGFGTIAVCPPVKMSPSAREHFKQALTANVVVDYKDDSHWGTYVSDDDEKIDKMAWDLLNSLAGFCYADGYDQWFDCENAELV